MSKGYWQHYSHPADMGIRGIGSTIHEAFEQAALALTALISDLETIEPREEIEIRLEDNDIELLFVSWLNTLLYEMAIRQMLFSKFAIEIKGNKLTAKILGEQMDLKKHSPALEVKAATYAEVKVTQEKQGNWIAQCIVDV